MTCPFSQFKNMFGAPGTGPHQYRFMGTAIVDLIVSIFIAIFITWMFKIPLDLSIILVLVSALIIHVFLATVATYGRPLLRAFYWDMLPVQTRRLIVSLSR